MAVNRPESEGEAQGQGSHKSLATVLSLLYIPPDWSVQRRRSLQSYMLALVTEINIATYTDILSSEKWLALCDPVLAVCVDRLFSCAGALHKMPRPAILPISTTANFSTSPTSSVQSASKCFKFAKEEKLSHVQSLLKSWFLKE